MRFFTGGKTPVGGVGFCLYKTLLIVLSTS